MGAFFGSFPVDEASGGGGDRHARAHRHQRLCVQGGGGCSADVPCDFVRGKRLCASLWSCRLPSVQRREGLSTRHVVGRCSANVLWKRGAGVGAPSPAPLLPPQPPPGTVRIANGVSPVPLAPMCVTGRPAATSDDLVQEQEALGCAIRGTVSGIDQVPTTCCCCLTPPPPALQSAGRGAAFASPGKPHQSQDLQIWPCGLVASPGQAHKLTWLCVCVCVCPCVRVCVCSCVCVY